MTGLRVGDRVWVGIPANQIPGHLLSINPTRSGGVEYVVRTIDLHGRPGENLNLRLHGSDRSRVLRPRAATDPCPRRHVAEVFAHAAH